MAEKMNLFVAEKLKQGEAKPMDDERIGETEEDVYAAMGLANVSGTRGTLRFRAAEKSSFGPVKSETEIAAVEPGLEALAAAEVLPHPSSMRCADTLLMPATRGG